MGESGRQKKPHLHQALLLRLHWSSESSSFVSEDDLVMIWAMLVP